MLLLRPRFTTVLAVFVLLATTGLQAATVTYSTALPTSAVANPLASGVTGVGAVLNQNVTGTITNQRRSPWDVMNSSSELAATGLYSSIRSTSAAPASAFFSFVSIRKELSFVWGTPGPLNKVEFFLNGESQFVLLGNLGALTSTVSPNSAQGLSVGGTKSILTTFTGLTFDKVVFSAGKPALEFANLKTLPAPVPVPAAGLLLLGALAGLGALRRRKMAV